MQQASVLKRFANNVQDDQAIREIVEDIRDALTTYQVSLQQDLLFANRQLIVCVLHPSSHHLAHHQNRNQVSSPDISFVVVANLKKLQIISIPWKSCHMLSAAGFAQTIAHRA